MTDPARIDFAGGDTTVAAYRWDPPGEPTAIVQVTHGMGEHALRYGHLAATLNDRGYVVYAQDHRGHGRTAGSTETLGQVGADGWTELVQDIGRLTAVARSAVSASTATPGSRCSSLLARWPTPSARCAATPVYAVDRRVCSARRRRGTRSSTRPTATRSRPT